MKGHDSKPPSYVGPRHVGEEILCVSDLCYTYPDGTEALRDVSFHVQKGSTLAVVGPNGAGKTTLLKILLGLLEDYRGTVEVAGMTPRQARRRGDVVSWVPQRAKLIWDFPVTVEQVVRMGLVGKTGMFARHGRQDLQYVDHLLEVLGIQDIRRRPIGEVSGGQQQRAIIARALAPRPAILMLDEPMVGVDQPGQELFAALMKEIKSRFDVTLVMVSHDLRSIVPESQRVACLNRTLHFHDSPSRLTPELLADVFRCNLSGLFPVQHLADGPPPHTDQHKEKPR